MEQVKLYNKLNYFKALNVTINVCLGCHTDCAENMCLELSYKESNSDKCTNCSSETKFLNGTIYTGGSCVEAVNCPANTRFILIIIFFILDGVYGYLM